MTYYYSDDENDYDSDYESCSDCDNFENDNDYYYYCLAAEEMNKNWEKYTDETMYPDVWKYFVNKVMKYYIYLDSIGEFIFNNNEKNLNKFSQYSKKIVY